MSDDVFRVILHILNENGDSTYINFTYIALIPKLTRCDSLEGFRRISLCNVVMKIRTKCIWFGWRKFYLILLVRFRVHLRQVVWLQVMRLSLLKLFIIWNIKMVVRAYGFEVEHVQSLWLYGLTAFTLCSWAFGISRSLSFTYYALCNICFILC